MSASKVAIIDGGGANIASLNFALSRLGHSGELTVDPDIIKAASHVILPGVGDAADSMRRLHDAKLVDLIRELTQPFLGICVGLQLLLDGSEENNAQCAGIFPGIARRFVAVPSRPVPHMGWNQVRRTRESDLLIDIPDGAHFYFVHSYAAEVTPDTLATSDYGKDFTAVLERDNVAAAQFHPERSGEHGAIFLRNFLNR